MTCHFPPLSPEAAAPAAILIDAARCWRDARDAGRSVQPSLFKTLSRSDCEVLAPVLDSLMMLCEAALGRSFATGSEARISEDEHLLLGLIDGSKLRHACIDCAEGTASALDCAICSTRIMMGLMIGQPAKGVLL